MTKILYVTLAASILFISIGMTNAHAQTDFKKIEGDELKNNPVSQDILKKIEIAKKQFEQIQDQKKKRDLHQKFIDEQRSIAKQSLKQEIQRMEKKYENFTPQNAFAKYVSSLNSTHHGIYWDQFDYLHTKVTLAKDARDSVLEQGGSYVDAMKQYVYFAKMPKIEMLNVIRDLNVKHNFANDSLQSNFDVNGKLPRYENDLEAPCYDCDQSITKVKLNSEQSASIQPVVFESEPKEIDDLRNSLSTLQKNFLDSKNIIDQKKMVFEMNKIVQQIQELE